MTSNVYIHLSGTCDQAFSFYEEVFGTKRLMTSRFADAPDGMCVDEAAKQLVMHTALPVGSFTLMGSDTLPGRQNPLGGFQISLDDPDESKIRELFGKLSAGGHVQLELQPMFWTPLFGMCTDKFGVGWMLSLPGPQ